METLGSDSVLDAELVVVHAGEIEPKALDEEEARTLTEHIKTTGETLLSKVNLILVVHEPTNFSMPAGSAPLSKVPRQPERTSTLQKQKRVI